MRPDRSSSEPTVAAPEPVPEAVQYANAVPPPTRVTAVIAPITATRFFDEKMNERAASRSRMETDLRRAIVHGELLLHFQPQVDARRGRIVGAEALVRWQHPQRGLVSPMEFIGLAEETGLILPLTDWVLEQACRTARGWRDAGLPAVPLSVNLAASSLTDATLVDKLDALMLRFGLSPSSLTLEMTETMLMRDVESAIRMLEDGRGTIRLADHHATTWRWSTCSTITTASRADPMTIISVTPSPWSTSPSASRPTRHRDGPGLP